MCKEEQAKSRAAVAAAAGLGVAACYLAARASKRSLQLEGRRAAAPPTECHVAVHAPGAPNFSSTAWTLVKMPKGTTMACLQAAVAEKLGFQDAAKELRLYPVLRAASGRATLGANICEGDDTMVTLQEAKFRAPAELQIIEVVCVLPGEPAPTLAPAPPPAFPEAGVALPVLGHAYHSRGPEKIPFYNMAANVFPPSRPGGFPWGKTVRVRVPKVKIADFPEGVRFHPDAEAQITMTADADVAQEILARSAEFPKMWNRPLQKKISEFTDNGLFTSNETSSDWQTGRNILPRGFNQIKVKSFSPIIMAKTRAFIREWASLAPGHRVTHVNHWLTSMTADAVVQCSMGLDMKNVERMGAGQEPHPFIDNFRKGLGISAGSITAYAEYGWKSLLPGFGGKKRLKERLMEAKRTLQQLVEDMVESTRAGELGGQHSIIRSMLEDKAANGKHVRYGVLYGHVINLMIAGHETTAATLGFTLQLLAENPECERRAVEEVRRVLQGRTEACADDVPKLQYVEQCFREALRIYSPVVGITRDAAYDTLLGGHRVYQGERLVVLNRAMHLNPEYWGGEFGDPRCFNPDRFSPEAVQNRHPSAYNPFGFGNRACIGSQFAIFEAKTFLASLLLHFQLVAVPGYRLTASLEAGGAAPSPTDLEFFVFPRSGGPLCGQMDVPRGPATVEEEEAVFVELPSALSTPAASGRQPAAAYTAAHGLPPTTVLFGSNAGASEEFARLAATAAKKAGFPTLGAKSCAKSLDVGLADGSLVADGRLVIVVTSTYNGQSPDNAVEFKRWLLDQKDGSLTGMRYAVCGVGNSQWHTYQHFAREVDAALARCGAQRMLAMGCCDVDGATFDSDFEAWLSSLLEVGGAAQGALAATSVDAELEGTDEFLLQDPAATLKADVRSTFMSLKKARDAVIAQARMDLRDHCLLEGLEAVKGSRELCKGDGRSVRHVTLRLPAHVSSYRAGDHLEVLPVNSPELVATVLKAMDIARDAAVCWEVGRSRRSNRSASGHTAQALKELRSKMPTQYTTAELVLQYIPDLSAVPGKKCCQQLAKRATGDAAEALKLFATDPDAYQQAIAQPQLSLAELLFKFQGQLDLTIGELCVLAKPLTPRFYSVSSSPEGAADPKIVTVTVAQVEFTTGSGRVHHGLASTMLGNLQQGDLVVGSIRTLQGGFHLPANAKAPIIMVGPGTGVAPMMGFLQEREHLLKRKTQIGPAMLFFGCRSRHDDYVYEDELQGHLSSGALSTLHVAFSREGPQKVYVQDVIREQREEVWKLLQHPESAIYVCGDARVMAPDVKRAFQHVVESCGGRSGAGAANMIAAMVEAGRYLEDVWAS